MLNQPIQKEVPVRAKKVILLFLLLVAAFLLFLYAMATTALKARVLPSKETSTSSYAERGNIISADGFHITNSRKLYKVSVNTKNIPRDKRKLFIALFHIYSAIPKRIISQKLASANGSVVLSYNIAPKTAQQLKSLNYELRRLHVFEEYEYKGRAILHALSIHESGETLEFPYEKLLTPLIGYPRKIEENGYTKIKGVQGVEKFYDEYMNAKQNALTRGSRDVNNYTILNRNSKTIGAINGFNVKINIPVTLQIRIELMLSEMKKKLKAKEIMIVLIESKTGKIKSLASSNRFYPKAIRKADYPALNINAINYLYEPGSVIKPITFAMLLEHKLVNPYDLVNGHNGRFKMGRKVIRDEHKFDWISAENVIVHSSNIGIAQLAQKLNGLDFHEGLTRFGIAQRTGVDLPYEKKGRLPDISQLNHTIYKATASYGYGLTSTLMQLVKAYNAFNNSGRTIEPRVADTLMDEFNTPIPLDNPLTTQIIPSDIASRMNKILVKTVNEGTGVKTRTDGLIIGGKTGTAHIAYKGRYVKRYNTSFVGFVNDETHKYTLGVTVIEPTANHFASLTAVPVFKKIVDILVQEQYLFPDPEKYPLPALKKKKRH